MAIIQIPNLPAVVGLNGSELFEGVQAGSSVKISLNQIAALLGVGTAVTFPLQVDIGGTGATTASGARTNLGLGTIATQNANSVSITGGTITGAAIDSTVIGGTTPANGTFATLTATGSVIVADKISHAGDTDASIRFPSLDTVSIETAGIERMRVDSGGRIGMGGTHTSSRLYLTADASLNPLRIDTNTGVGIEMKGRAADNSAQIRFLNNAGTISAIMGLVGTDLRFYTGGANERMRIFSTGGVSIGNTTDPGATNLSVTGSLTLGTALTAANGGTGNSSYAVGDILYASGTTTLSKLADVATGNALISGGVGVAPSYGKIGLTTHVSGTLPVANGGTGVTTAPAAAAVLLGYTSTATAAGTTTLTNTSTQYQIFTGTNTQTITLPVTSTLATGWSFHIVNNSTGNLTINSSGGNLVATLIPQVSAMVTCIGITLTTAADWEFGFTDFGSVTGTGAVVLGTGPTITNGAFNGTVGATTASTGAFTTLSASSTVSGTGFSTYLASPPAIGGTAANTGAFTTVTGSTSILSSGAGGVGYSTGAGVAVTQLTSRTNPVPTTGNKTCGTITMFSAAGSTVWASFTVPNTAIAATDTVVLSVRSATNLYILGVTAITAGTSFQISFATTGGTAVDAPIINFTIIRGVSA